MFWGRNSKPEEIKIEELPHLLNSLFEKKLGNFGAEAQRIAKEIRRAHAEFEKACNELEIIDAEPYVQNIYFENLSSIKSQKAPYARTLKKIIMTVEFERRSASNTYGHYRQFLSGLDAMRGEVLKANATFKLILYCYAGHMGNFRKSFADLEKYMEMMRRELESRSKEASEFSSLSDWISRLNMQLEERQATRESVEMLKQSLQAANGGALEKEESELAGRIGSTKGELAAADAGIKKLSGQISLLTTNLERPARKMDHLSMSKRQLHQFMADPIGTITDREEFGKVVAMVKELREDVEKGSVDTKNKEGTLEAISLLLDSDLYGMISSLRLLQQKRLDSEYEIRDMEITLNSLEKRRGSSEKAAQEVGAMEKRIEDTGGSVASSKKMIEKLFLEYYRRPLSITLEE